MEFTLYGFDVYQAEVDDKGIDFVIRKGNNRYYDIQVKSVRGSNSIYFNKSHFDLRGNLYATIVLFKEDMLPDLFLIPSTTWLNLNSLFVSRDYPPPRRSEPEWGLNLSAKNYPLLQDYAFEKVAALL
jgi:hypothetical protein